MLYALFYLFGIATVSGLGARQVDLVHRATAQKARKTQADKLRGSRVVRYWLDNARPSRAPQGHAGLAG
jgi:hypothetical protein